MQNALYKKNGIVLGYIQKGIILILHLGSVTSKKAFLSFTRHCNLMT